MPPGWTDTTTSCGRAGQLDNTAAQNPYHDWIETYAASGFEDQAATLEGLLERYAEDRSAVRLAYRRAMQLELAFFGADAPRDSCSR